MNLAFGFQFKMDGEDTEIFYSVENNQLLSDIFNQKFNDQIVYHYKQPPPDFVGGVTRYKINFISRTVVNIDRIYGAYMYDLKMV